MTAILEHPRVPQFEEKSMENLATLSVWGGKRACHIDHQWLYIGSDNWRNAPFRVDMDGNTRMNNAEIRGTISGRSTDVIASAIDPSGNFVSDSINLSTKTILKDFTFAGYEWAFKTGNIAWNRTTGTLSSGTGILINNKGIIGAKNGAATFSITTDGDAIFAGKLESPNGKLGTITAGTIIGATIKTASSGGRIEVTSGGMIRAINGSNTTRIKMQQEQLVFYDSSGNESGYFYGFSPHKMGLNGSLSVWWNISALNGNISSRLDVGSLYVNGTRIDTNGGGSSGGMQFVSDTGVGVQVAFGGNIYHLKKV